MSMPAPPPLEPAQRRRLQHLWMERDTPISEIAEACGCSTDLVQRTAAELGLPSRALPIFDWSAPMLIRAKRMYEDGCTPKRVARALTIEFKIDVDARAVSNRAHRDKWRPAVVGGYRGQNMKAKVIPNGPQLPDRPMPKLRPDPVPHPSVPKVLADAEDHECKYPQGDAPGGRGDLQLYCCEPRISSSCYCDAHTKFVYPRGRR